MSLEFLASFFSILQKTALPRLQANNLGCTPKNISRFLLQVKTRAYLRKALLMKPETGSRA